MGDEKERGRRTMGKHAKVGEAKEGKKKCSHSWGVTKSREKAKKKNEGVFRHKTSQKKGEGGKKLGKSPSLTAGQ